MTEEEKTEIVERVRLALAKPARRNVSETETTQRVQYSAKMGRPIQEGQERTRAGSISLYPAQWAWLEAQAGEGSVSKALQKLINDAIAREPDKSRG